VLYSPESTSAPFMIEQVPAFITAVKNAGPVIYAAVLIATSLLLFLPPGTVEAMGLEEFRSTYRTWLGVGWLSSASLLGVHAAAGAVRQVGAGWRRWRVHRRLHKALHDLTFDEKLLLRKFVVEGETTLYQSISDGVAQGLVAKTILFRSSNLSVPGTPGVVFPYNLQPYALRALSKNPSLLE
jgi:hypothetical protein